MPSVTDFLRMWVPDSKVYEAFVIVGCELVRCEGILEGEARCLRRTIIRIGTKRFGEPDPFIVSALESIFDLERLEELAERLVESEVCDWETMLQYQSDR